MNDTVFIPGLSAKAPHEKAPDFVKAKLSIKVRDLLTHLQAADAHGEEWINADVKVSKAGNYYVALDTWKPKEQPVADRAQSFPDDDIPNFTPPDSDSVPF